MGNSLACSGVALTVASVYECTGFRLPTAGEWEYAARAGTRTTFYSGNYAPGSTYGTTVNGDEPMLDSVAWYHGTSKNFSQPVGQKLSNGWGLYDVLGNAFEWVFDEQRAQGYGAQQVADPGGELVQVTARQVRGEGHEL